MEKKKTRVIKTLILAVGVCISLSSCNDNLNAPLASRSASGASGSLSASDKLSAEEKAQILADAQTTANNFEQAWDGTSSSGSTTPSLVKSADSTNNAVVSFMKRKIQATKQHSGRYLSKSTVPDSVNSMKTQLLASLDASVDSVFTASSAYKEIARAFYNSYVDILFSYYATDSLQSAGYRTAIGNLISSTNNVIMNNADLGKSEIIDLLKTTATLDLLDQNMLTRMTSSSRQSVSPMQRAVGDWWDPRTWAAAAVQSLKSILTGDPISCFLSVYTLSWKGVLVGTAVAFCDITNLGGSFSPPDWAAMFTSNTTSGSTIKSLYTLYKVANGSFMSLGSQAYKAYGGEPNSYSGDLSKLLSLQTGCMSYGQTLQQNQSIFSANKYYELVLQVDGSLAIYKRFYLPSWKIVKGLFTYVPIFVTKTLIFCNSNWVTYLNTSQLWSRLGNGGTYSYSLSSLNGQITVSSDRGASYVIYPMHIFPKQNKDNQYAPTYLMLTNNGRLYVVSRYLGRAIGVTQNDIVNLDY